MQKHDINGLTSVESPQCIERHLCACSDWMQHLPDCTKLLHALHTVGSVVYMQNMWLDKCVCGGGGVASVCRPPPKNHKWHSLTESTVSNTETLLPSTPLPLLSKQANTHFLFACTYCHVFC